MSDTTLGDLTNTADVHNQHAKKTQALTERNGTKETLKSNSI